MSGAQLLQARVLLLGQKLAAGVAKPLIPVRITNLDAARTLFGAGSMLATMAAAALSQGGSNDLWAMPIEDPVGSVKATATITMSGLPTAAGTVALYIGGRPYYLPAGINADPDDLIGALMGTINVDRDA